MKVQLSKYILDVYDEIPYFAIKDFKLIMFDILSEDNTPVNRKTQEGVAIDNILAAKLMSKLESANWFDKLIKNIINLEGHSVPKEVLRELTDVNDMVKVEQLYMDMINKASEVLSQLYPENQEKKIKK